MANGKMLLQIPPTLSNPRWLAESVDPCQNVVPMPAKLDPTQFEDASSVLVTLTATASGGKDQIFNVINGATGGNYTWNPAGLGATANIAFGATPAQVQTALELIIGVGNIRVFGQSGANYDVQFTGAYANAPQTLVAGGAPTGGTVVPTAVQTGVASGATSLAVSAISAAIPSGTILDFGNGVTAKTTAAASAGATSLTVAALRGSILSGATAYYRQYPNRKQIPSGTLVGRTTSERLAGTAFGPAVYTDDEVYLIIRPLTDANNNPDIELYRPGHGVKENFLPNWTAISGNANLLAKLRSVYQCITGQP